MNIVLTVMNTAISQQTAQTEYHHQACLPAIEDRTPTQDTVPDLLLGTTTGTGIRIAGLDHSHTLANITVTVAITQIEVIPDHSTDATTEALHDVATPALTVIAVTHHTGDHPHIEVCQLNLEIAANPDHSLPITQIGTPHLNQHPGRYHD